MTEDEIAEVRGGGDRDITENAITWMAAQPKLAENEHFFAVYDRYPVRVGHALIVAKRLTSITLLGLSIEEFASLQTMIDEVVARLWEKHCPAGYNIGANCNAAAGQVVMRFHMHVIPRYEGEKDRLRFEEEIANARVV